MKRAFSLLLVAACGGDPATPDANLVDTLAPRCSPTAAFGAPMPVMGLNTVDDDVSARFSQDELTVVFSRRKMGMAYDLFTATRTTRDGAFNTPTLLATVNSVNDDVWPTLSPDGLLLVFDTNRGTGTYHVFISRRASLSDPFGPASAAVALMDNETHPMMANARALYFASSLRSGLGLRDVYRAEIDSTGATSTPVAVVGGVNTVDDEVTPAVSADELRMFFRRIVATESDVFTVSRSTATDGWGTSAPVPGLAEVGVQETPTWVSPDGCALYFFSNVATGMGGDDMYVVMRGT